MPSDLTFVQQFVSGGVGAAVVGGIAVLLARASVGLLSNSMEIDLTTRRGYNQVVLRLLLAKTPPTRVKITAINVKVFRNSTGLNFEEQIVRAEECKKAFSAIVNIPLAAGDKLAHEVSVPLESTEAWRFEVEVIGKHLLFGGVRVGTPKWTASAVSVAEPRPGATEGAIAAKRHALLRLLANRGLPIADAQQARISACNDVEKLDLWFDRALGAKSAEDALS